MRFGGNMVSVALVGLTTTLVSAGFADGKKDAPRAPAAAAAKKADNVAHRAHGKDDAGRPSIPDKPVKPTPAHKGDTEAARAPGSGMHGQRLADLEAKEREGTLTDKEREKLEKFRQKQATHKSFHETRQARLAELHQKKQSGKLSDAENSELDKLAKAEERLEALDMKHKARAARRAERQRASKREILEAHPWLLEHSQAHVEFAKHGKRLARLERTRELADAAGRDELVARIDRMLAKETSRHQHWLQQNKTAGKRNPTGPEHASNVVKGAAQ